MKEILDYLAAAFPAARVLPPPGEAATLAAVFAVLDGQVERQLEVAAVILTDLTAPSVVQMLRTNRIAETMRAQPGRRIALARDRCGELIVEIETLRTA
jgi:hypothetical protein